MDLDRGERRVRRFVEEVWNGRNYPAAADLYSEHYVSPFGRGPEAKAEGIRRNHHAFPDLRVDIEELFSAGETTVLRLTLRGTDLGGYAGRPPTGRSIDEWAVNIMHFEDDRVVNEFMGSDKLGLFIQLGVIDDPWPASPAHSSR